MAAYNDAFSVKQIEHINFTSIQGGSRERGTINRTDEENGTCKSAPTDKHLHPKHARDRETDGWRKRWGHCLFFLIDLA